MPERAGIASSGQLVTALGRVRVRLRPIGSDEPRPSSPSPYDDWGQIAPRAADLDIDRWVIEIFSDEVGSDGPGVTSVGDMTALPVWFGPTTGSMAMNIGIGIVEGFRGRGIGSIAQGMLADLLHDRGIVRVQASTDVTNEPEQRALAKAGFAFEGIAIGAQVRADGRHDLQVWSHVRVL